MWLDVLLVELERRDGSDLVVGLVLVVVLPGEGGRRHAQADGGDPVHVRHLVGDGRLDVGLGGALLHQVAQVARVLPQL